MSDFLFGAIQSIGVIGTLLIAVATLRIANRQNEIASDTAKLSEVAIDLEQVQATSAQTQAEVSNRLARLEESRETPILIPDGASLIDGREGKELYFSLVNVGGGTAVDIRITAVAVGVYFADGSVRRINLFIRGSKYAYCKDELLVRFPIPHHEPPIEGEFIELSVIGIVGCYRSHYIGVVDMKYGIVPTIDDTLGIHDQLLAVVKNEHNQNLAYLVGDWNEVLRRMDS